MNLIDYLIHIVEYFLYNREILCKKLYKFALAKYNRKQ